MRRYFPFLILALFLLAVFGFSSQNAMTSNGISHEISVVIQKTLIKMDDRTSFEKIHYTVRKIAHVIEYMMLSVILASGMSKLFRRIVPALFISGIISIFIAFLDEFVQSFSIERTSKLFDVYIDITGIIAGLCAIGIFSFFRWFEAPKRKRN